MSLGRCFGWLFGRTDLQRSRAYLASVVVPRIMRLFEPFPEPSIIRCIDLANSLTSSSSSDGEQKSEEAPLVIFLEMTRLLANCKTFPVAEKMSTALLGNLQLAQLAVDEAMKGGFYCHIPLRFLRLHLMLTSTYSPSSSPSSPIAQLVARCIDAGLCSALIGFLRIQSLYFTAAALVVVCRLNLILLCNGNRQHQAAL